MAGGRNAEIRIRRAKLADGGSIVAFNQGLAEETEEMHLDPQILRHGVEAVLKNPDKGFYLVAEMDGITVGQLMITYEWSDWRNGTFWWIQSVYVAKDHRRRGVFRALFERARELASERRDVCGLRLYVHRDNSPAKRTYSDLGMRPTEYDAVFEMEFHREKGADGGAGG